MKIVLITDGTSEIGREIALKMSQKFHIIFISNDQKKSIKLYDEIEKNGGSCTAIPFDMRNFHDIHQISQSILDKFNKLDCVVFNSEKILPFKPIQDYDIKETFDAFSSLYLSQVLLLQTLHPLIILSDARIVNVQNLMIKNAAYSGFLEHIHRSFANLLQIFKMENPKITIKNIDYELLNTEFNRKNFPGLEKNNVESINLDILI